ASADLAVLGGVCTVNPGATYMYRNINIYDGGQLVFGDGNGAQTDLWAANIIVEDKGTMRAGSVDGGGNITPINGPLIIHLYGANQGTKGVGAVCLSDERCGVPKGIWDSNNLAKMYPNSCSKRELPNDLPPGEKKRAVKDCFYPYDAMTFDNGKPNTGSQDFGYFGYKVIGLGYGGTLQLYGKKGATYDTSGVPSSTEPIWARLNNCISGNTDKFCNQGVLQPGATLLTLSSGADWQPNDNIVVSSTDYLPGHAEQVKITACPTCPARTFMVSPALKFPHN